MDEPPCCRICLGGADDDGAGDQDGLGELFAPCECRGTAAFVHPECLFAWREAVDGKGAEKCTTCGYTFRLEAGRNPWLRLIQNRAFRTAFIALYAAFQLHLGMYLTPLLTFPGRDRTTWDWRDILLPDFYTLGSVIRGTTSIFGLLLGDCTPFAPSSHPGVSLLGPLSTRTRPPLVSAVGSRPALSACHRLWGYRSTVEQPALLSRALIAIFTGALTWGLVFPAILQFAGFYHALLPYLRRKWPARTWPNLPMPEEPRIALICALPMRLLHLDSLLLRTTTSPLISVLAISLSFTLTLAFTALMVWVVYGSAEQAIARTALAQLRVLPRVEQGGT
ncbi:hypothetical protein JCM10207_003244 [Rhodosporidiobolus poonsookiae]